MEYHKLEIALNNCPKTWVGALLILLLKRTISIPVFKPGKLIELVKKLESQQTSASHK